MSALDIFSVAQIGIRYAHFMPICSTPKMPMTQALNVAGADYFWSTD